MSRWKEIKKKHPRVAMKDCPICNPPSIRAKPTPKGKRLVRGKDWHLWMWKRGDGRYKLFGWSYYKPTAPLLGSGGDGKWVRVKFVEVSKW